MSDRIDARTVLSALAAVAALAGGVWFVQTIAPVLSVTVQSLLLLLAGVAALAGASTLRWREGLAFVFASCVVAAVGYAAATHALGVLGTLALVVVALAAVFAVAYLLQARRLVISPRTAGYVLLAVALVGAALVGVDLRTDPVSYDVTVADSARVPGDTEQIEPVAVGTATAENAFVFREQVDFPAARACVDTGTNRTNTPVLYRSGSSYYPGSVGGNGELTAELTVMLTPETAGALNGTVPVERAASCPEGSGDERITVVVNGTGSA